MGNICRKITWGVEENNDVLRFLELYYYVGNLMLNIFWNEKKAVIACLCSVKSYPSYFVDKVHSLMQSLNSLGP